MANPYAPSAADIEAGRKRTNTISSVAGSVTNTIQSKAVDLLNSDPPTGFFNATAAVASQAPTLSEIRRGSYGSDLSWRADPQIERRRRTFSTSSGNNTRRASLRQYSDNADQSGPTQPSENRGDGHLFPALMEEPSHTVTPTTTEQYQRDDQAHEPPITPADSSAPSSSISHDKHKRGAPKLDRVYTSGYVPPTVVPWTTSTWIGLKAFLKWFCTPFGFLLTLYACNVVAWGGMLFLLLCNASPAMCWAPEHNAATERHVSLAAALRFGKKYPLHKNCNDINSPRRIWLEIDSQILNALFCVTGFGLIPWRFRDLYYLLRFRLTNEKRHGREKKLQGLRTLAGIHNGWYRLPGSQTLDELNTAEYIRGSAPSHPAVSGTTSSAADYDPRLALPLAKNPEPPLTGIRAPPTDLWKLDFSIWSQVWNTFFQVGLCVAMWGYDRYDRPSWTTGFLIACAFIIAGLGGFTNFLEGKKVKRVEGVRTSNMQSEAEDGLHMTETGHESVHFR